MAALSGLGAETPSAMALGAALELGELLAVLGSLAPAPAAARLVAGSAVSLGLCKVVGKEVFGGCPADDLLPLDRLDVAQVVVVDDADASFQNV